MIFQHSTVVKEIKEKSENQILLRTFDKIECECEERKSKISTRHDMGSEGK
jgi:di/tripeptidase